MAHRVAVGALISERGVLMVHRRPDLAHAPGLWSFPGGHLEPGETPALALLRELREELGVRAIVAGTPRFQLSEDVDRADGLIMSLWVISSWTGTPTNGAPDENDELRWVSASDLDHLELAHWTCREVIMEHSREAP
jgi:8-oxo-dGTP diphosphatase